MGVSDWSNRYVRWGAKGLRIWRQDGWRRLLLRTGTKFLRQLGIKSPTLLTSRQYQAWIALNEPSPDDWARQPTEARAFAHQPLISFITPVYNPPAQILRDTLESVRRQTYGQWELCLVDGASTCPEVLSILESASRADARVRLQRLGRNMGISGNTNEALKMARGEFVAFLDHDDVLAPHAAFEVVRRLNEKPQTDIVYFDEDLMAADSHERREPFFKPDWSPEMLLSSNYLTHPVVRAELVRDVGWFDPALDGAQDWDFMFRCTERTDKIEHIAQILYHWRAIPGSCAAGDIRAKPYALRSQIRAVAEHLRRQGVANAEVFHSPEENIRAVWPALGKKVSIIIPTRDKVGFLRNCLAAILEKTAHGNFEIIVVDNGSRDKATRDYYVRLRAEPRVRIIAYDAPFNYSQANNLGAGAAQGELLLFLNNDTEALTPDWLEEMARWAERPEIGVVGALLLYPDAAIQHAGVVMGMLGHANHVFLGADREHQGIFGSVQWYRNYSAVTGACMMMRRAVFDQVGGFDEGYQLAFSDVEMCLRVAGRGFRIVYTPYAVLRHHEGQTRCNHAPRLDYQRGYEQMRARVAAGDPYFNPNLSYGSVLPKLKEPAEEDRLARLQRMHYELGLAERATNVA